MICVICRAAGNLNKEGPTREGLVKDMHEKCDGRCDCQHVVGRTAKAGREPK